MDRPPRRRRTRTLLAVSVTALVAVCLGTLPSPYVIERPGPVVNTLGQVTIDSETKPVLTVAGATRYPAEGTLNLLTVNVLGTPERRVSWAQLIWPVFDPAQQIVPLEDIYPAGQSSDDRKTVNDQLMTSSQSEATAAALRQLGYEVPAKVTVGQVGEASPANGVLRSGDVITAVDGVAVQGLGGLRAAIQQAAGKPVSVTFTREGESDPRTEKITPVRVETGDWVLGVTIGTRYDAPVDIGFVLDNIGGPSAGMVFSLAIIDELTPGELTAGKTVSGTGTIDDAGNVGAIGGLPQKMYAAAGANTELFLMPRGNCGDQPQSVPGEMTVAVVGTLDEAQRAIERFADGKSVPGLETCAAPSPS